MSLSDVVIIDSGHAVSLVWEDGARARFHAIWLRDNAPDADTRSPQNGQRLLTIHDIPAETIISSVEISNNEKITINFIPDAKQVEFDPVWLKSHIYDLDGQTNTGWTDEAIVRWDGRLQSSLPVANYQDINTRNTALLGWLEDIRKYGFALLRGLPVSSGSLCQAAELFGYVRETNYGRWFEVRSEINPTNLAYTGLGLQAHTDNPYRDPVPTLQLLACLENTAEGGDSIIVDGFKVAERLKQTDPDSFQILSQYCARFEYEGSDNVSLQARRPIIELAPDGELLAIRFNNRSASAFTDIPYDRMQAYYDAYRKFAEIVDSVDMEIQFKMSPGDLFIVDNTRVLHARKAFSGTGERWLQGCYADKDGLLSTVSVLRKKLRNAA